MVYYCMNSELPLIQSTENDIINIMGSSKKTQKVGGTFKKKRSFKKIETQKVGGTLYKKTRNRAKITNKN